jgi:hypothetical protein
MKQQITGERYVRKSLVIAGYIVRTEEMINAYKILVEKSINEGTT